MHLSAGRRRPAASAAFLALAALAFALAAPAAAEADRSGRPEEKASLGLEWLASQDPDINLAAGALDRFLQSRGFVVGEGPWLDVSLQREPAPSAESGGGGPSARAGVGMRPASSLADRLESDRRLLAELRKPIPMDRQEAQIYFQRIHVLAGQSDPVRLSMLSNKLLNTIDSFYDWLETDFETAEEQIIEYYLGGARAFYQTFEEFRTGVLLAVINRLDSLADLLE